MRTPLDALCLVPQNRVNTSLLERALVFGFSSGDTNRAFEKVLETATSPESHFNPACFQEDLFLDDFVTRCLPSPPSQKRMGFSKRYLTQLLSAPPLAETDTLARQAVLQAALAHAPLQDALRELHRELCNLRELLCSGDFSARVDPNPRRLDILRSFQRAIRGMSESLFATPTLLGRLREFGQRVESDEGYKSLCHLLAFEQEAATLDLRVSVGLDGQVRRFDIIGYHKQSHPEFKRSWFSRVVNGLSRLWHGYKLTDQELLSRLLFRCFDAVRGFFPPLFQLIGDLDFYLSALTFREFCVARKQAVCFPTFLSNDETRGEWQDVYNPFLLSEGIAVRPTSLRVDRNAIVVLTGPNSGGKTRIMQSLALTQLLGQAGWPIPARSARIAFAGGLFVSMLDDVRADQREGRLGMELLRIRRLFEQVNPGDLVFIDELCSGTNPSEGEEIFELVLQLLGQLGPQVWLSTHFLKFVSQLAESGQHSHLQFLRVALDSNEHPTFEFEPGVASTSLARQTAARLGVTREELTELVMRARTRARTSE